MSWARESMNNCSMARASWRAAEVRLTLKRICNSITQRMVEIRKNARRAQLASRWRPTSPDESCLVLEAGAACFDLWGQRWRRPRLEMTCRLFTGPGA